LTAFQTVGQRLYERLGGTHFREVSLTILRPPDGRSGLSISRRMEFPAGPKPLLPRIPGFLRFAHATRSIPANQQAKPIIRIDRIIPSFGLEGHENILHMATARIREVRTCFV